MLSLDEIKENLELVNSIEWEMTPEEAVTLYLEWGNNWSHGRVVRSKDDVSHYFVVYNWDEGPIIYLIRRNSDEAKELARIEMPDDVKKDFLESVAHNKGVYSIEGTVKNWLKKSILN